MTDQNPTERAERKELVSRIEDLLQNIGGSTYEEWCMNNEYIESEPTLDVLRDLLKSLTEYESIYHEQREKELEDEAEATWAFLNGEKRAHRYQLKQLWMNAFSLSVHDQPHFGSIYFYMFCGQWFKSNYYRVNSIDDDLRIHTTVISDSSIGKTETNNFLSEVCKVSGLRMKIENKINDGSIIGTIDRELYDLNQKKGYTPDNPKWQDPVKYGTLHEFDFVIFDEAERVLKPSAQSEEIQLTLQTAMNRIGSAGNNISNTLVRGTVQYPVSCSIGMTSIYSDEFRDTMMTKGLIQRTLVYVQRPDLEKRRRIEAKMISSVEETAENKVVSTAQNEAIKKFVHELRSISKPPTKMIFTAGAKERILKYKDEARTVSPLTKGKMGIFNSIVTRDIGKMFKLSAINALIEGRTTVDVEDVDEMYHTLVKETMHSIAKFIDDRVTTFEDNKLEKFAVDMRERLGGRLHSKEQVNQLMMEKWNVTRETAIRRVGELESYYTTVPDPEDGRKKMIRMK